LYYGADILNTEFCAPVKIFEYINCGLKIVATMNEGLKEYDHVINKYIVKENSLNIVNNDNYSCSYINRHLYVSYESQLDNILPN
jgi:hypothetical protein